MNAMTKRSQMLGEHELSAVLRQLPEALQRNALSSIARAGAVHLKKDAEVQLGLSMGRTVREDDVIIKKRRSPKGEVRAEYNVGPPTRKPWLRWLHNGTDAHEIEIKNARVMASGDAVFGVRMTHPGQPPRPWLERAYFLGQAANMRAMAAAARKAILAQVRRLASSKYTASLARRWYRR